LRADEAMQHPLFIARGVVQQAQHPTEGSYQAVGPAVQFHS
jgi:crotonobetainyl-CoA:carnitine CoA-transferase CaiB-like acyl-CoA transferase